MTATEENEKKKEYLKSYQRAVKREQEILDEIQRLRADKLFPATVGETGPEENYSDLEEFTEIIDGQIELLKSERLEKIKIYTDIEARIKAMDNEDEQTLLRLRYIIGLSWEEVAVAIGYSWRQTHRIHGDALRNF